MRSRCTTDTLHTSTGCNCDMYWWRWNHLLFGTRTWRRSNLVARDRSTVVSVSNTKTIDLIVWFQGTMEYYSIYIYQSQQWPWSPSNTMHLDLSWLFSIFKVPKLSRPSDRNYFRQLWRPPCYYNIHNVKSRHDFTFTGSIPDLKTNLKPLPSTSESIVKAGLNNIWRTNSKPPSHAGYASEVPSVSLQKDNATSRIPTHLQVPFPHIGRYIPAELPRASGSRLFSIQKAVNREPAKGSESNRRKVGLDLFTSSLSSFQTTPFDFHPDTVSPSQSLLFLPPSPPPKRQIVFNPEEDTVPLPLAPEPKTRNNPLGTTSPIRNPDREFHIKTLPSPSLPTGNSHFSSPRSMFLIKNPKTIQCLIHPTPLRKALTPGPFPLCLFLYHFLPCLRHLHRSSGSLSKLQVLKDTWTPIIYHLELPKLQTPSS